MIISLWFFQREWRIFIINIYVVRDVDWDLMDKIYWSWLRKKSVLEILEVYFIEVYRRDYIKVFGLYELNLKVSKKILKSFK